MSLEDGEIERRLIAGYRNQGDEPRRSNAARPELSSYHAVALVPKYVEHRRTGHALVEHG
jgi:hypothetical protein